MDQVQEEITTWVWDYNQEKPNMALGWVTSMQKLLDAITLNNSTLKHKFFRGDYPVAY